MEPYLFMVYVLFAALLDFFENRYHKNRIRLSPLKPFHRQAPKNRTIYFQKLEQILKKIVKPSILQNI